MTRQKTLQALTLRHPWPYAILHLGKDVENRTWFPSWTQLAVGERLAIHGGAEPKGAILDEALADWESLQRRGLAPGHLDLDDAIRPGIVGVGVYGGIVTRSESPWFAGPKGWRIAGTVALPEPVACRGKQGLWSVPPDLIPSVRAGYKAALTLAEGVAS